MLYSRFFLVIHFKHSSVYRQPEVLKHKSDGVTPLLKIFPWFLNVLRVISKMD